MSLLNELKRRNVFKVGAAYLALAWVVVQATGAIVPALNLPATLVPTVVWIGVIGFPCVLLFSWVYELTPEGLKRESEIDRSQSITHVTGKRLDYLIIGMLAVAIGLFVLDRIFPNDAPPVAAGHARDTVEDSRGHGPLSREQTSTAAPDEKSIAVLPFIDMSQAKDQEYFSDGIAEELLNLLAKIPELKVIARTSSFAFKGKETDIADIARKLNVAHVLEGSVRKSGNRVRITAQLIRTADSTHLWSNSYDRSLDDIFAVQDEIAGAVVGQLKVTLLGEEAPVSGNMKPAAYSLYMEGLFFARQGNKESQGKAEAKFKSALALDPTSAEIWAELADVYASQAGWGFRPMAEGVPLAKQAADRALALDPGSVRAHTVLAGVSNNLLWDFEHAADLLARALELEPGNVDAIRSSAALAATFGRLDEAIALQQKALDVDPLRAGSHHALGYTLFVKGDWKSAEDSLRRALEFAPDRATTSATLSALQLVSGRPQEALRSIQHEYDEGWRSSGLPMILFALGRKTEADAALSAFIEEFGNDWAYQIAENYAFMAQHDAAFEWLERAYRQPDAGLIQIIADPVLRSLHDDPRWLPFLTKLRLDRYWPEYKAKYLPH